MFGAIMSIASGAISAAATAVGTVCSTIGGAIMKGVGELGAGLLQLGKMARPVLDFINTISTIMGVKPVSEDPAEIGLKAHKCGEIPEDYYSVEEYIKHLRKDIELDKEEVNKLSDKDKLMYTVIGSALYVKNMEEKYDMEMPQSYWEKSYEAVESGNMTAGEVKETLDSMKKNGVKSAESFSNYMDGKANMEEQMVIYDSLKEAMHKEFPDLSDADLNTKVTNIKDFMQQNKK